MRIIPRSCEGYDPGGAGGDRIQVAVVQSLSVTCNTTSHIAHSNGHGEEEASIYKRKSQLQCNFCEGLFFGLTFSPRVKK